MAKKEKSPEAQAKNEKAGKAQPWTFPQHSLEEAIRVIQQIETKFAGKPVASELLVKPVGFRKANDWRYQNLLRSTAQYGLIEGTGIKATVALTDLSDDILSPSSPSQRQEAIKKTFEKVDLFKQVLQYYAGKKIPEDEYFENTLVREFKIPKERVKIFIKVFSENLNYLRSFSADKSSLPTEPLSALKPTPNETSPSPKPPDSKEDAGPRQFLDTCFILMPFGSWFDRYFKDIYVPATKEAGFEPVRADEIFTTGSVIEQIWEQITKAKVLLAELTGKNPNVFYELGLAHASRKPVVLIAGALDDIPFDLRHLRTVIYDIREPDWSEKLKKNIAAHLKSAKTEPEKTIPQPFRELPIEDEEPTAEDEDADAS